MILITSANGKTGHALMAALSERGLEFRAMTRSDTSLARLSERGAADVVVGDLRNREDVARACDCIEVAYFITPNFSPDESVMADNLIDVCSNKGVRVVLHSVIHPQIQGLPHHWSRLLVEEKVINSYLDWVVLQPTTYMQNITPQLATVREVRELKMPIPIDRALSMVDLDDIAEVAAAVLTDRRYDFGVFELCGEPVTLAEQAEIVGRLTGEDIRARTFDTGDANAELEIPFVGDYGRETTAKMYAHYASHGLRGNTRVLAVLLDRMPTCYEAFAERELTRLGVLVS